MKKSSHSRRMAKQKEKVRKGEEKTRDGTSQAEKGQLQQQQLLHQQKMQDSSDEDDQDEPLFSLAHRLSEGYIPDAVMIHAARKKREIARQLGTAGDADKNVMSLNSTKGSKSCLLYTSPSPRDATLSRMPSSA